MQLNGPLSPALSPSEGEREKTARAHARSPVSDSFLRDRKVALSPSEGERVGERGFSNFMITAKGWTPNPNPRNQYVNDLPAKTLFKPLLQSSSSTFTAHAG
jgi:hypothetical protein